MLIPHIKKTTGDVLVHFRKRVPGRINAEAVSAKKPGWNHRAAAVKWHPLTLRFSRVGHRYLLWRLGCFAEYLLVTRV